MVDTRDILLKAAEDVTQGMWCKFEWFNGHRAEWSKDADEHCGLTFKVFENLSVEDMQKSERCVEGSLILATRLLGGDSNDYEIAANAALLQLLDEGRVCSWNDRPYINLFDFNDDLPEDPFEAGQQLAELFRTTAESL